MFKLVQDKILGISLGRFGALKGHLRVQQWSPFAVVVKNETDWLHHQSLHTSSINSHAPI